MQPEGGELGSKAVATCRDSLSKWPLSYLLHLTSDFVLVQASIPTLSSVIHLSSIENLPAVLALAIPSFICFLMMTINAHFAH